MPELKAATPPASRGTTAVDWALRTLIAAVFVFEGTDKLGSRRLWIRLFAEIGLGQWFRYATGLVEITGALLMLVPRATPIAATMLACTMVGALIAHVVILGAGPQTAVVSVLLVLILVVAWRRRPPRPRQ